jgi:RNA polymerase sigma-70 factor, ECF subfamily
LEAVNDQAGDDDRFIRLFSKSQCSLYAFILGMTHNSVDADDLLQELNVALWKKRTSYDPQQEFLRWALGFARIEIKNYRRKNAKARLLFSDDVLNTLAQDWPSDMSYHEQRLAALASCVKKLGSVEYQFISGFYRRNASVNQLAELHSTPASTVYKILSRAREALHRCVQRTIEQSSYPSQR